MGLGTRVGGNGTAVGCVVCLRQLKFVLVVTEGTEMLLYMQAEDMRRQSLSQNSAVRSLNRPSAALAQRSSLPWCTFAALTRVV